MAACQSLLLHDGLAQILPHLSAAESSCAIKTKKSGKTALVGEKNSRPQRRHSVADGTAAAVQRDPAAHTPSSQTQGVHETTAEDVLNKCPQARSVVPGRRRRLLPLLLLLALLSPRSRQLLLPVPVPVTQQQEQQQQQRRQ